MSEATYLRDTMTRLLRLAALSFLIGVGMTLNVLLILALVRFLSKGMC